MLHHFADNIDPNLQDSMLVVSTLDWALAEFVRLYHTVSANEVQGIVESLVTRSAPVVQDFAGFLKLLNPGLSAGAVSSSSFTSAARRGQLFRA